MHWGVEWAILSLTLITGMLERETGVWNCCLSLTGTWGRPALTGVGLGGGCVTELEFSKFMTGLEPVQWAKVSTMSGSQMEGGSDTSPALHRDSKLCHKKGFNFSAFLSASAAGNSIRDLIFISNFTFLTFIASLASVIDGAKDLQGEGGPVPEHGHRLLQVDLLPGVHMLTPED